MEFRFSEDQGAFADAASALFTEHCGDDALRAHDASGASYQRELWRACIGLGLHSIVVPEGAGGLGLGMAELEAVLEAQGSALALVPLWEHQLVAATVAQYGVAGLRDAIVPRAMDGEILLTTSLTAVDTSRGATLKLVRGADGWRLRGRVNAVPLGDAADYALLGAAHDGATRLVLVDLAADSVHKTTGRSQHHQGVADLQVDDLALDESAVLGGDTCAWFEPRAIACLSALQLGVTQGQLAQTVGYVSERKQFGRAIGSFQLVTGRLADAKIQLEALRSAQYQLVYRLDAGLGVLPQALAVRVQACDLAHESGHRVQHVHGGMGVDVSAPAHRYLYWNRALEVALGAPAAHLQRLADWLADHDELGWKYDLPEDDAA